MLERKKFYDSIRPTLFNGKLSPKQFEGLDFILNEWEISGLTDLRWLAYMLATTYHETAFTMQAVKEYGSDQYFVKRYWENKKIAAELGNRSAQDAIDFCGKGFVQLTGRYNYKKMGPLVSADLVKEPHLAMNIMIAAQILFEGMTTGKSFKGDFTGKHLGNYFNKTTEDWIGARRIINGDKAALIAGYGKKFLQALNS